MIPKMILKTKRLVLRPWKEKDAADLFELARNPHIGPIAGWPPHTSIENSCEIIKTILSAKETYAVILRSIEKAIGSISFKFCKDSNLDIKENEVEIGYWVGEPYWGQEIILEAANELIRYGFQNLGLEKIWCGCLESNKQSKRVQEKCGFVYQYTQENVFWPAMNDIRTEHITCLTKDTWEKNKRNFK